MDVDEAVETVCDSLRHPGPVLARVVNAVDEAVLEVAAFDAGFDRGVAAENTVMRDHAVGPIQKRAILQRVAVAERRVVERIAAASIVAFKIQNAERLPAEGPLDLGSAIERPD